MTSSPSPNAARREAQAEQILENYTVKEMCHEIIALRAQLVEEKQYIKDLEEKMIELTIEAQELRGQLREVDVLKEHLLERERELKDEIRWHKILADQCTLLEKRNIELEQQLEAIRKQTEKHKGGIAAAYHLFGHCADGGAEKECMSLDDFECCFKLGKWPSPTTAEEESK